MTEMQYIELLTSNRRFEEESSCLIVGLVDEAVKAFPCSAELWCLRGDIIQMGSEAIPYELSEVLRSYQEAVRVAPNFTEAYEELGYYYDVIEEDYDRAELAFRKALEMEHRIDTYVGLARVMAERGNHKDDILAFLDSSPFQDHSTAISEMRSEIEEGLWSP